MLKKRGRIAFPNLNEFQLMNKFLEFNAQDLLDVLKSIKNLLKINSRIEIMTNLGIHARTSVRKWL
jgi:hypothetical protein